jgi:phosphatidate cytidylyltransferase
MVSVIGVLGGPMVSPAGSTPRLRFRLRRPTRALMLRMVSAAFLLPPTVFAIWVGAPWFDLLLIGAAGAMGREWARMTLGSEARPLGAWALSGGCAALVAAAALDTDFLTLAVLLGAGMLVAPLVSGFSRGKMPTLYTVGFPVIAVSCTCWLWLRVMPDGRDTVLWLMGVVWATDTGAYFVGRMIGGPRLAPMISPNKTWAGLIGGMAAAGGIAALIGSSFGGSAALLALLGAGLAIVAQTGDLAESALKRHAGVKDSGRMIPGHGGILDRVDGLMPVALVLVLLSACVGWSLTP